MKKKIKSCSTKVCYLCGLPLGKETDKDHVPPKQFFGKQIREQHDLNLLTKPTHPACNKSFKGDEEYFKHSLSSLSLDTPSGWAIGLDIADAARKGHELGLIKKVMSEFDERPGGLFLPGDNIVKHFETERIGRVIWKVTRGLYFHHEGGILPEETPYKIVDMLLPEGDFGIALPFVVTEPSQGEYPGVFDYKYVHYPQLKKWSNLWAFLLWDKIKWVVVFQNPQFPQC